LPGPANVLLVSSTTVTAADLDSPRISEWPEMKRAGERAARQVDRLAVEDLRIQQQNQLIVATCIFPFGWHNT
jgi:hypothetical protein